MRDGRRISFTTMTTRWGLKSILIQDMDPRAAQADRKGHRHVALQGFRDE
jgi:hypothetical protein